MMTINEMLEAAYNEKIENLEREVANYLEKYKRSGDEIARLRNELNVMRSMSEYRCVDGKWYVYRMLSDTEAADVIWGKEDKS